MYQLQRSIPLKHDTENLQWYNWKATERARERKTKANL